MYGYHNKKEKSLPMLSMSPKKPFICNFRNEQSTFNCTRGTVKLCLYSTCASFSSSNHLFSDHSKGKSKHRSERRGPVPGHP